jgi:hypothetical protein
LTGDEELVCEYGVVPFDPIDALQLHIHLASDVLPQFLIDFHAEVFFLQLGHLAGQGEECYSAGKVQILAVAFDGVICQTEYPLREV